MTQRGRRDTDAFDGRRTLMAGVMIPSPSSSPAPSRSDHSRRESAAFMLVQKAVKGKHSAFAVVIRP